MQPFEEKNYPVFDMFRNQWALCTAGTPEHYNTCTIAWGSMGTIWGRSVVTVYINPDRYTWEFLKEHDTFTVSFYPPEYRKALNYLGSHSGKDEDKVQTAGLTPKELGGGVTFEEAELTFVCHKLQQGLIEREGMAEEISQGIYKNWQPHWYFIGEVIEAEDRQK